VRRGSCSMPQCTCVTERGGRGTAALPTVGTRNSYDETESCGLASALIGVVLALIGAEPKAVRIPTEPFRHVVGALARAKIDREKSTRQYSRLATSRSSAPSASARRVASPSPRFRSICHSSWAHVSRGWVSGRDIRGIGRACSGTGLGVETKSKPEPCLCPNPA
jgi:hypothetical protein